MKRKSIILLFAMLYVVTLSVTAQTDESGVFTMEEERWQKISTAHRLSQFPKIHEDGRLWFRFEAPETAQSVRLRYDGVEHEMSQDTEGRWNAVIMDTEPGFQIYHFDVDGVDIMDPGVTPFYVNGYVSVVDYPAPSEDYYLPKAVPHGDVREHWFYSDVAKEWRRMFIYTPPGYEKDTDTRYPVLYLQHGAGEMENEWVHAGRANFILDNLIADGRARPMIVVMNNDFVYKPGDVPGRMALAPDWAGNFGEMLINEVIPDVDASYRTLADQQHRAMAGLSLGGMLTNQIGMEHINVFSHFGLFSGGTVGDPATAHDGVMADAEAFNKKVKLIFHSCGSKENPERVRANHEQLVAAGIRSVMYVSPNTAHEWQTWRRSLYEFLPHVFNQP